MTTVIATDEDGVLSRPLDFEQTDATKTFIVNVHIGLAKVREYLKGRIESTESTLDSDTGALATALSNINLSLIHI